MKNQRMRAGGTTRTLLAVAIAFTLLLHLAATPDHSRRSFEILPDMLDSIPFDSQGSHPVFVSGATLQLPAPGTAAVGYPAFRYEATPEEALRAGRELSNPIDAGDSASIERGAFIYSTFCQMCHGGDGGGGGPMTKRGVPPPPSLFAEHAVGMKDGQLYHLLTLGQGNMASYASQVERSDRWKVILHVRSLQKRAAEKGEK